MSSIVVGSLWVCLATSPHCDPSQDPTGTPPAQHEFPTVESCETAAKALFKAFPMDPKYVYNHSCATPIKLPPGFHLLKQPPQGVEI